jgi:hypothetical protein
MASNASEEEACAVDEPLLMEKPVLDERAATSAGTALAALVNHKGPALIDLDETLYLRNSTEDFIDSAVPKLLACLLMRALDVLKPWRIIGGAETRDVWRVRALVFFFPWTFIHWRFRVVRLAARHVNQPLMDALRKRGELPIIATNGFRSVVKPLIAALGLPDAKIVAARIWAFEDRRRGKLWLTSKALGLETVSRSLVLTDSLQDSALLSASALPLLTTWPDAAYVRAFKGVYLPGEYVTQVKRPGERFIIRGILQEDFAYWILSSIALAAAPLFHVAGLLFLLLSFWAIYEAGYVDNDVIAATLEKAPKLSKTFYDNLVATPLWQPWIWAVASGAMGIYFLHSFKDLPLNDLIKWTVVLLSLYTWFCLYNRFDKGTRIWMFPILQLARSAAFIVLAPVTVIGACALGAHALSRWMPYFIYRYGGKGWPEAQPQMTRLLFLSVFALLMCTALGWRIILSWWVLALFGWTIFRARHEMAMTFSKVSRLDRRPPRTMS